MQETLKIEETNPARLKHNIEDLGNQLYLNVSGPMRCYLVLMGNFPAVKGASYRGP